jgi:molybdenum cofactor biosynthesis protein B
MSTNPNEREFKPLKIAIMTVSDTRTEANDKSGDTLVKLLTGAGHTLAEKRIVPDNIYQIRAAVSQWIADDSINAVITTGGTGITGRDTTPEAVSVLFDKQIDGFGEVFRAVSYEEINTSTIQSRAVGGVGKLISHQLDYRTRPCNLVELMPRVLEK